MEVVPDPRNRDTSRVQHVTEINGAQDRLQPCPEEDVTDVSDTCGGDSTVPGAPVLVCGMPSEQVNHQYAA
jgi:hypothetical protein